MPEMDPDLRREDEASDRDCFVAALLAMTTISGVIASEAEQSRGRVRQPDRSLLLFLVQPGLAQAGEIGRFHQFEEFSPSASTSGQRLSDASNARKITPAI